MNMEEYLRDMNAMSPYELGKEKQFPHNAKTTARLGKYSICPEMMAGRTRITIEVDVYSDVQHDGRLWGSAVQYEDRLVDEIMSDIRNQVGAMVGKINPFGIHCEVRRG